MSIPATSVRLPGRVALLLAAALLVVLPGLLVPQPAAAIDGYASYQPPRRCAPAPRRGTRMLADWLVRRGGERGGISRPCSGREPTSEHNEGRAFDWSLNHRRRADRQQARWFVHRIKATDRRGRRHALARRMGIMYVIWNDRIWSSYNGFRVRPYLSSSCRSKRRCSRTLRHRDHMHISLSRQGARARTSWYRARLERRRR